MKLAVPLLLLAVAHAMGCQTVVPYRPDRTVTRGIPADRAKAELARVLGAATTWVEKFTVAQVGDDGFTLREPESGKDHGYRYAALAPQASTFGGFDGIFVRLTPGTLDGWTAISLENDIVMVAKPDDVEILLDALESLKTDALARH